MANHFRRWGSLIDCQLAANGLSACCCKGVSRFQATVLVAVCVGIVEDAAEAVFGTTVVAAVAVGNCCA